MTQSRIAPVLTGIRMDRTSVPVPPVTARARLVTATAIVDPRRHRPNARADHADACCGSPLQMRHDPWPLPRRRSGADNAALSAGPHAPSGDTACPHVA